MLVCAQHYEKSTRRISRSMAADTMMPVSTWNGRTLPLSGGNRLRHTLLSSGEKVRSRSYCGVLVPRRPLLHWASWSTFCKKSKLEVEYCPRSMSTLYIPVARKYCSIRMIYIYCESIHLYTHLYPKCLETQPPNWSTLIDVDCLSTNIRGNKVAQRVKRIANVVARKQSGQVCSLPVH
jgi:hypothetical protein